jgi:hypothetical protein
MPAGYSGTPLAKKLSIAVGSTVALLGEPADFRSLLVPIPDGVDFRTSLRGHADVVVFFTTKRASKVSTDMTEDVVRDVALPRGLVDNKVCAIDDVWSGLRIVWSKERR